LVVVALPALAEQGLQPPRSAPSSRASDPAGESLPWWDLAHATASDWVIGMAKRFDQFFGDPRLFESEYDKTHLRVRVGSQYHRLDGWNHGAQLRLRLPLPLLADRLRLVVDSDEADWLRQRDRPPFEPTPLDRRKSEVGLEYGLVDNERGRWTIRLTGGPKVSLRYRQDWALAGEWRFQACPQIYLDRERDWGVLVGGDLLRPVGQNDLLRLTVQADEWGDRSGTHWRAGADWNHRVSPRTAWSAGWWVSGVSSPQLVTEHRFSWRWRQSLWRPWFFYEIEPSVGWRRQQMADGQWEATRQFDPAIAVRLEVQLGKIR